MRGAYPVERRYEESQRRIPARYHCEVSLREVFPAKRSPAEQTQFCFFTGAAVGALSSAQQALALPSALQQAPPVLTAGAALELPLLSQAATRSRESDASVFNVFFMMILA